jgi:hypothetical protein
VVEGWEPRGAAEAVIQEARERLRKANTKGGE